MKAIVITEPGGPEVLQVKERPTPVPEQGEVLIKVIAAGVNRPDVAQRKGHYPPPKGASPDIPGLEVAGIVEALGKDCTTTKPGDKVCALVSGGGYAGYCTVPEGQLLPIPDNLSFEEAASLPETFFTVWSNVFDRGQLKPGQKLLVHGGSSGIGVAAIQLAKAWGATVYVTAGTDEKCSYCEELGAERAINYKSQSFKEEIKRVTSSQGVDVILDMIGGDYTPDNLECLAEEGRLVLINVMRGDETKVKLSMVMRKRLTITGSTLRARDTAFKSSVAKKIKEHVWPWLEAGVVKPVVYKTFPLEKAADAHRLMESSTHIGKIVLLVG
ncbi:NAD(P)H-quinone oxidoreductase [Chryseolinea sp. H1M3-3]|uniref:NAD(P)H-quinone oxidoreductase n=1 Tax=Chryseolinea sp. H1M3-3 TaxID=3034144 RepID=UPI0023ECF1E6|nr:NAD(P)H-quinone oxidoreductase [Chryseolinea sp. H1M3-3]